jgi:hypothetical protein
VDGAWSRLRLTLARWAYPPSRSRVVDLGCSPMPLISSSQRPHFAMYLTLTLLSSSTLESTLSPWPRRCLPSQINIVRSPSIASSWWRRRRYISPNARPPSQTERSGSFERRHETWDWDGPKTRPTSSCVRPTAASSRSCSTGTSTAAPMSDRLLLKVHALCPQSALHRRPW